MKRIPHESLTHGDAFQTYLTLGNRRTYWLDTDGAGAERCLILSLDDKEQLEKAGLLDVAYIDGLERLEGHHAKANGFTHLKVEIRARTQKLDGQKVYGIRLSVLVRKVGENRWTSQPKGGVWR